MQPPIMYKYPFRMAAPLRTLPTLLDPGKSQLVGLPPVHVPVPLEEDVATVLASPSGLIIP
jgi:hypothetical protein